MARFEKPSDVAKCSFCGKTQQQVGKLIAGPGVYICNECIDLCNDIIEEEGARSRPPEGPDVVWGGGGFPRARTSRRRSRPSRYCRSPRCRLT